MKLSETDIISSINCKMVYDIPIIIDFGSVTYSNLRYTLYYLEFPSYVNLKYNNDAYIASAVVPRVRLQDISEYIHTFITVAILNL